MIENLEYNLTSHADTMDGDSHPSSGNVMPEVTTDRHANTLRNKQPKGPTAVRMSTLSKDQTNLKQLLAQTNQASCVDKYFADQISKQLCFYANLIRYRKAVGTRLNLGSLPVEANHSLSLIQKL